MDKIQTLLEQAQSCADAACDDVLRNRDELSTDIGAFAMGRVVGKLVDVVGELHKIRRMLPGYSRNGTGEKREDA